MKLLPHQELEALVTAIFVAAGTPDDIAQVVAASLVDSNLKGVDSHGVLRVPFYLDQIEQGWIDPGARPTLQKDQPGAAIVQGQRGFGIYTLGYALDLAIEKAKTNQIATVGLVESTHTGRVGWFAERAARQGVIGIIVGGGAHGKEAHMSVAPHGGAKRIIATNPYTIGLPAGRFPPVVVDISTSMTAEGKLKFYRETGSAVPPGWIINQTGQPSTNVADFYSGGMILPIAGHKGYGLGVAAEFLAGILLGEAHELNWLILALESTAFRSETDFAADAETFLQGVKAAPPAPGFDEVLIPGEPEARMAAQRSTEGIPLPDTIWENLQRCAHRVGVVIDR
jgi:LDH2 family malate/lactate/ureidoglycolate dehydrogenase